MGGGILILLFVLTERKVIKTITMKFVEKAFSWEILLKKNIMN